MAAHDENCKMNSTLLGTVRHKTFPTAKATHNLLQNVISQCYIGKRVFVIRSVFLILFKSLSSFGSSFISKILLNYIGWGLALISAVWRTFLLYRESSARQWYMWKEKYLGSLWAVFVPTLNKGIVSITSKFSLVGVAKVSKWILRHDGLQHLR